MAVATIEELRATLEASRNAQAEVVAREQAKLAQIDASLDALKSDITRDAPKRQDFVDLGITLASKRLLEAAGPDALMSTREIADGIRQRGVVTKSKNFIPTVYATLANSDLFTRVDGKWGLRKPRGERHESSKQESHSVGSFAPGASRGKR